jgi:alanine or glycine:cation symporter, AGCS family
MHCALARTGPASAAIQPYSDAVAGAIFYSVPVAGTDFPLIVGWLIVAAIVFTLLLPLHPGARLRHAIAVVRGRYSTRRWPGEVTPFQALTTAVSGTVGLGNIAGVAVAVAIGGAGRHLLDDPGRPAGHGLEVHRVHAGREVPQRESPDGIVSGGPMRYLSKGLAEQGRPGLGKVLAVFFAICCVGGSIGGGNMFQANQSFQQVVNVTGGEASPLAGKGWLFGLVMAVLVGLVIIGGIKSIAA